MSMPTAAIDEGTAMAMMAQVPGVWLGFVAGKAVADVAWYGMEASARRGVAWSVRPRRSGL